MDSDRGLFIDGAWRRRGGAGENPVLDPATDGSLGDAPMASADDARDAIEAVAEGARAKGVGRPAGVQSTVITGLPDDAEALAAENFGPVAATTPFGAAEAPFGGVKHSGQGREAGSEGIADDRDVERARVQIP